VFARGKEVKAYADRYDVRRFVWLDSEVRSRVRDDEAQHWELELPGCDVSARFVISAIGSFGDPQPVAIDGLEQFPGAVLHSAGCDHSVETGRQAQDDLDGRDMAPAGGDRVSPHRVSDAGGPSSLGYRLRGARGGGRALDALRTPAARALAGGTWARARPRTATSTTTATLRFSGLPGPRRRGVWRGTLLLEDYRHRVPGTDKPRVNHDTRKAGVA
jgi:hypothetical protein